MDGQALGKDAKRAFPLAVSRYFWDLLVGLSGMVGSIDVPKIIGELFG
jgi:hypothetical protein